MGDSLILVGRVAGAFGVRGEVRITSFTAEPAALLDYRDLKREDGAPALTLTSGRPAKGGLVVRAAEVETREQAEAYDLQQGNQSSMRRRAKKTTFPKPATTLVLPSRTLAQTRPLLQGRSGD